jgi:ATP-dependent protease HslVU (ClpYQ) peptidase subunit
VTCIAYRDGVLAADSQATAQDGLVTGRVTKIWRLPDGGLCGGAGAAGDMMSFLAWAGGDRAATWHGKDTESGFSGVMISPQGEVSLYDIEGRAYALDAAFYARGVGAELAIGAMAMGATAEQAVEVACRFSVWCGGPIHTLRLVRASTCADTRPPAISLGAAVAS